MFRNLIIRDLKIAFFTSTNFLFTASFFLLILILIPFIFGSEAGLLKIMFEGLIWIALILSILLTLGRIFNSDYDDGNLDIILQSNSSLELIICAKYIAYWTTNCLPLILFLPIVGQLFNFTFMETIPLMINLGISSFGMVFIATCISSLTLGAKRTTFLKGIIIIPLYIPFIIFGVDTESWPILIALSMIAFVVSIYVSIYSLRLYGE
jgi:heme exporter protein B